MPLKKLGVIPVSLPLGEAEPFASRNPLGAKGPRAQALEG
jgi:hypothetical protein